MERASCPLQSCLVDRSADAFDFLARPNDQARALNHPDRWSSRLMFRLLPFLFRTGLLLWLQRKERRQMSDGVVPVRLVV